MTTPTWEEPSESRLRLSEEERLAYYRERDARDRKYVADKWFQGDTERADRVFAELPFSDIPDWWDVEAIMRAINGLPEEEHNEQR